MNINASKFYRAVRKFAVKTPSWGLFIRYDVKQDEINDLTLIARRVYGTSSEALAVMAAAGLDRIDQSLIEGSALILPTKQQLEAIKQQSGYSNTAVIKVR